MPGNSHGMPAIGMLTGIAQQDGNDTLVGADGYAVDGPSVVVPPPGSIITNVFGPVGQTNVGVQFTDDPSVQVAVG